MGPLQNIEDILGFLARRRWLILATMVLCGLLGAVIALQRPHQFTASTSIEVQTAQVTGSGGGGGERIEPGREAMQMLQSVRQRLTTRDSLLLLGERHGLLRKLSGLSTDEQVTVLRAAIAIDTIMGPQNIGWSGQSLISGIVINVTWDDPEVAARLANDLAQQLMDMSATGQIRQASDTFDFYSDKRASAEAAIREQENRISRYRSENAAALPPATDALQDEMVSISVELRSVEARLLSAAEEQRRLQTRDNLRPTDQQRLRDLDDQIILMREQEEALSSIRGRLQLQLSGVPEIERGLADLERRLEQMRRDYDNAQIALSAAESALQLAESQQRERFAVLDQALAPEYPSGRSRRSFVMVATMGGAVLGLILSFLLEMMNPVLRTSAQLQRETGLRPVIAIPVLEARRPPPRQRRRPG